ncbi:hypothetical protein [Bifidobacterium apicola]|uniref:hypothetical protein n=1 Tax=Bifidobacterium apicola TaxID=3230739 RepID=UPI0036F20F95
MMPESSGGVSGGAEDRVDAFVLSSVMSRVVGSVPHARPGSREFSLGGVLWKTVLYALTYAAAFACGWFLLFDQDQDWIRIRIGQGVLLALLSIAAVAILLGRYEDGKGRPGPWFVVLSLPFAPGFGVIPGSGARYSGGVFRWVLVSVAVLVVVGGVGVSGGDAAGAQRVRVVGGDGGIVCGAILDAGQGDGVCWRVLVLVPRGGYCRRLVVCAGHAGDRGMREHAS